MVVREEPSLSRLVSDTERPGFSVRLVFLVSVALTLVLYALPYGRILARPLVLLSTLAHEMGHGLTALLLGGGFERLEMWSSGAGAAHIDLDGFGRLRQGLTMAGGLMGPPVAAAICFVLARTGRGARACLAGLGVLLLISEALVVRNLFAFVFVGLLAAACLFAAARCTPTGTQLAVVFMAAQLALSVFSRADYLFTRMVSTPNGPLPSDVYQMQQALFLPYWFWGAACGMLAVGALAVGLRISWSAPPRT